MDRARYNVKRRIRGLVLAVLTSFAASNAGAGEPDNDALAAFSDAGAAGVPLAAAAFALYKGDQQGLVDLGLIWMASVGVTTGLKKAVDATRPNGKPESFPSRHAASAFAGAAFLHQRYGWRTAAPAYGIALGVGYGRVESDEHYWRDVAMSAALASVSAWLLTSRYAPPVPVAFGYDPAQKSFTATTRFRF